MAEETVLVVDDNREIVYSSTKDTGRWRPMTGWRRWSFWRHSRWI